MLDIARRSEAKDGTVPPEPAGPMEVAPRERSTSVESSHTPHHGFHPSVRPQPPSEIVTLLLSGTTSLIDVVELPLPWPRRNVSVSRKLCILDR